MLIQSEQDIYDIKGLQTAAGNRAYTDLYGAGALMIMPIFYQF